MRASFVFASLVAAQLVGCLPDKGDEGMYILNNTAPTGTSCTLTGDTNQAFIARGAIVANSPSGYVMTPLIKSRITANEGFEDVRTIHLEGANVSLSAVGSNGTLGAATNYTVLFSGSVAPQGTTNVAFTAIPASSLAVTQNTELVVTITPYGSLGGGRIEGEPFQFPVTVCTNCLLQDIGMCSDPMTPTAMNKGNPCNVFQDYVVDCCLTNGGALQCPGPL